MSYVFTTSGGFDGDLGASNTIGDNWTIGIFTKIANHPAAAQYIVMFAQDSFGQSNDWLELRYSSTDNTFDAYHGDGGATSYAPSVSDAAGDIDGLWVPIVVTNADGGSATLRVNEYSNSASGGSLTYEDAWRHFSLNLGTFDAGGAAANYAEFAIWDSILGQTDIENYMSGTKATSLSVGPYRYWSLDHDDDTPNDESGNSSLALSGVGVAGTDYDYAADHPTITTPSAGGFLTLLGVG